MTADDTDKIYRSSGSSTLEALILKELQSLREDVRETMNKLSSGDEKFNNMQSEIKKLVEELDDHVKSSEIWRERIMKVEWSVDLLNADKKIRDDRSNTVITAVLTKAIPWLLVVALGGSHLLRGESDVGSKAEKELENDSSRDSWRDRNLGNPSPGDAR